MTAEQIESIERFKKASQERKQMLVDFKNKQIRDALGWVVDPDKMMDEMKRELENKE